MANNMSDRASRAIRKATAVDVPAIVQIRSDGVAFKLGRGDLAWGEQGWTEATASKAVDSDDVYVIEQDGKSVGMMSFSWEDEFFWGPQNPDAGYMHRLAVRHGCHGHGLGEFAIEWCVQRVLDKGRSFLRLDCDPRNAKLCAYYEGQGFQRVMVKHIEQLGGYVASLYERQVA